MAGKYFLAFLVACAAVQVIYGFPSIGDIINKIKDEWENVEEKMKGVWDNIKGEGQKVWDEIKKKIQDIISGIKGKLNQMDLEAKTGSAKDCIAQARDQISKAEAEIEPKIQACMEQVKKDMEPMASKINDEVKKLLPEMSDEVKKCMSLQNWQECIKGAGELGSEMKDIMGDAGKMAQLLRTEAKKAMECATPIMSDMQQKGQTIMSDVATCMKNAIGA